MFSFVGLPRVPLYNLYRVVTIFGSSIPSNCEHISSRRPSWFLVLLPNLRWIHPISCLLFTCKLVICVWKKKSLFMLRNWSHADSDSGVAIPSRPVHHVYIYLCSFFAGVELCRTVTTIGTLSTEVLFTENVVRAALELLIVLPSTVQ